MTTPSIDDIEAAAMRIRPHVRRTPVLRSEALDAATGAEIFVKAECLQRFGAFKARGAFSKLTALDPDTRARGVLAFSSGNHAQAVAGAAATFGAPAVIVMPADAPRVKIANTRALGGEVVLYDRIRENRESIGAEIAQARGLTVVKPFDDPLVIAGQGTAGLELAEEAGRLDFAIAPASGGGLVGGLAVALGARSPGVRVYAAEPQGHDDIVRSLASGAMERNAPGVRSICDALLSESMGAYTWPIARACLAGAVAVCDADVRAAMRFAFSHLRIVLEPGGAIALAALLTGALDVRGRRVGVVASGGNVDPAEFARVLTEA